MAQSASPVSGVAARYAGSLFDLARDAKAISQVEADLRSLGAMIKSNAQLSRIISSPVISAAEQLGAIGAIAAKSKMSGLVGNFLRLVAKNRRISALPSMIAAFGNLAAAHRGEASADVTSAHALSPAQRKELAAALKGVAGKDVSFDVAVDPSLLGGLVVKMGSRQIDTSLRTKLSSLKSNLKEAG